MKPKLDAWKLSATELQSESLQDTTERYKMIGTIISILRDDYRMTFAADGSDHLYVFTVLEDYSLLALQYIIHSDTFHEHLEIEFEDEELDGE